MKLKEMACIILYNPNEEVLLQHRTKDAEVLPDYWGFFGGSVEDGETPKEAAIREVYEELNFIAKDPKLVMRQEFVLLGKRSIKNVFIELCKDKSPLKLKEGQGWGWYAFDETKKLKMIFHDREVLQYIKDKL